MSKEQSYTNAYQGNSAVFAMSSGAAVPVYTLDANVMSDTKFLGTVPDAIASKVAGTLKLGFADGGECTVALAVGQVYRFRPTRIYATGSATITAADITLLYEAGNRPRITT